MWHTAADTLRRIAELGARAERVFALENLNLSVDHPGTPFARAADTLALARAVDSPHLRLNLDLYHAQIGEGNLIELPLRHRHGYCRRSIHRGLQTRAPKPRSGVPRPS